MASNKDGALGCIAIAREAIASGNRQRAVKFIAIARRLDPNLGVDDLLAGVDNPESASFGDCNGRKDVGSDENGADSAKIVHSEEQVQLIKQIKSCKDYYGVLGVEKSCSLEDIWRAYKKISLKVHPDKNKAPGSEDAFKKVSKAFKCLSDDDSRRRYDQTEFEHKQQYNVGRRRRRRTTEPDLFDDDLDPDEMFKAFFGQSDMFRTSRVYRTRTRTRTRTGNNPRWDDFGGTGPNLMLFLQILPILLILLLAYLPFSESDYSLQMNYSYQFPKITEKHGVDFFVKSREFDLNFPLGSPVRANIENSVIRDYKIKLGRYCHVELQRRHWSRNLPTPHCDKLQSFGLA